MVHREVAWVLAAKVATVAVALPPVVGFQWVAEAEAVPEVVQVIQQAKVKILQGGLTLPTQTPHTKWADIMEAVARVVFAVEATRPMQGAVAQAQ
jgi:hypothetical protein